MVALMFACTICVYAGTKSDSAFCSSGSIGVSVTVNLYSASGSAQGFAASGLTVSSVSMTLLVSTVTPPNTFTVPGTQINYDTATASLGAPSYPYVNYNSATTIGATSFSNGVAIGMTVSSVL